jgi:hypothetical protein
MNKPLPFPEDFEEKIQKALDLPEPDPEYVDGLLYQIKRSDQQGPKRTPLRLSYVFSMIAALMLMLSVFLIGPQNVYAAIREWLGGYIPGVGFVDTSTEIRGIEEPVSITVQGVVINILEVVADSEKTIIIYSVDDSQSTEEQSEATDDMAFMQAHDYVSHSLYLPNGDILLEGGSSCGPDPEQPYDADGSPRFKAVHPAIPQDVDTVTFKLFYHPVEIPLELVPYKGDSILPMIVITNETTEESPDSTATAVLNSTPHSDIQVGIDSYVDLDDGYILIGYRSWQGGEDQYLSAFSIIENLQVTDASGSPVAFEQIPSSKGYLPEQTDPLREVWGIKILGKEHAWPITITHQPVVILPAQEVATFEIDLGDDPQVGQNWVYGMEVPIEGVGTLRMESLSMFQGTAPLEDPNRYGLDFLVDCADNPGLMVTFKDKDYETMYLGGGGSPQSYNVRMMYDGGFIPSGVHTIAVMYKPLENGAMQQVNWQP